MSLASITSTGPKLRTTLVSGEIVRIRYRPSARMQILKRHLKSHVVKTVLANPPLEPMGKLQDFRAVFISGSAISR